MAKLKRLLPTLRERKRYLVFEILSDKKIEQAEMVRKAVDKAMLNYVGTRGAAQAGMLFLKDKYQRQKGMIKVNHKHVDTLKNAMMFITHIDDAEVAFRSVGTSGMIKKAEEKYLAR